MHVDAFIEDSDVVMKILKHLGLWEIKRTPLSVANVPSIDTLYTYDDYLTPSADDSS